MAPTSAEISKILFQKNFKNLLNSPHGDDDFYKKKCILVRFW